MVGIMVSASTGAMNSLLGKLATLMGEECSKRKNLRKEVKSISDELRTMNNFLERLSDVDELDKQTKGWRDEVREMSYDIEDIIDDFKQHIGEKDEKSGIVNNTIERLKTLIARHRIASQIKDIKKLVLETRKRHKRYLIIIDDIWNAQTWRVIRCAFPENDLGSTVIATTRIQDVAGACCSHRCDHIFNMKPLSDKDSRMLFFGRIFGLEQACPQELTDVSIEILRKCGGLPLAIISISSMLSMDGSKIKERWEYVQSSLGSGTNLDLEGMRQILNLSYRDLPPNLKSCLLYLGMYPEDYIIKRVNLERQWMAEGFIHKEYGQDVEKVARNHFNELINRSLIQPVMFDKRGSVTQCRLHDMMLDLILLKSAEENFFTIVDKPQAIAGLDYKIRRLSIRLDDTSDDQTMLPRNTSMSQVRSVMFFGRPHSTPSLSEFKFLRVLFIDLNQATVDLTGLRKLYLLRYLWICDLCLYQLPTRIRVLQQLETLYVLGCKTLPPDIVHLPRLMHLNVKTRLPDGIGNMKSLRHLCAFDFAVNTVDNIKGLGEMTNLKYPILDCYLLPNDMERRMDALCSSLGRLCGLKDLLVRLTGCIDELLPLSTPPSSYRLERLSVLPTCWFSRVPSWIGELRNLTELQCRVVTLQNDGVSILAKLPSLTHLDIKIRNATDEMIIITGKGAFPALKGFKLLLSSVSYLTFQGGAMSNLQRITVMFNAKGSEHNGFTPAGIEHLTSLEEFTAEIGYTGAQEPYKIIIESALRSAIALHPSHPRLGIQILENNFYFSS